MKVCVIDHTKTRRGERLTTKIRSFGYSCDLQRYVWPGEDKSKVRLWDEEAKKICRTTAESADIFLLHGSNEKALVFARDLCRDKYVIFYSGGALAGDFIEDCARHSKHCIAKERVGDDVEAVNWDLEGCLKAIARNDPDFCVILNSFDPLLETKLNLLYQALDACHNGGNTATVSEGWALLRKVYAEMKDELETELDRMRQKPKDREKEIEDLKRSLTSLTQESEKAKEAYEKLESAISSTSAEALNKLKKLRDVLLPE